MDIHIFLRDLNDSLVKAWEDEFNDCGNVTVSRGNIFDIKADAIISPANSFGFMDGGIDLAYSAHFGWGLQDSLQKKIREEFFGELPVGSSAIVETNNQFIKYLLACPTMRIPEDVSGTVNAYLAFRAGLIEVIKFNNTNAQKITSILCPGLGTLTGRIPAIKCARQMKRAYDLILNPGRGFPNSLLEARDEHTGIK